MFSLRVYYDKLGVLKAQLAALDEGVHPEYVRGAEKYTAVYNER
jgi:hypothetical protein